MEKVTKNEYSKIMQELAKRVWKSDETHISIAEYERMLNEDYEIIPFELNLNDEELKNIINVYCETEEQEKTKVIYRGSIEKEKMYELWTNKNGYEDLYFEYYQCILKKDDCKAILSYCEGDFTVEIYKTLESYNKGIEVTKNFIEEM